MKPPPFSVLTICGLEELDYHSAQGVSHVLSILDPDWPEPDAFRAFDPHLRTTLHFHDAIEPGPGIVLPQKADVEAILEGLTTGTIDAIATDHAPHQADEKHVEFDRAPFGIIGLETAVSLTLDRLVHGGVITLQRMVQLLSVNPCRILKVPGGTLGPGHPADVTIIAPSTTVTVDVSKSRSLSRNSPFDGWALRGAVAATIVGGRTVFVNHEVPGAAAFGPAVMGA